VYVGNQIKFESPESSLHTVERGVQDIPIRSLPSQVIEVPFDSALQV